MPLFVYFAGCRWLNIRCRFVDFSNKQGTELDKLYNEFAKMMLLSMNHFMELVDLDAAFKQQSFYLAQFYPCRRDAIGLRKT